MDRPSQLLYVDMAINLGGDDDADSDSSVIINIYAEMECIRIRPRRFWITNVLPNMCVPPDRQYPRYIGYLIYAKARLEIDTLRG